MITKLRRNTDDCMKIRIDTTRLVDLIQVYKASIYGMNRSDTFNVKEIFEMGIQTGMQLQKAISNVKVEQ